MGNILGKDKPLKEVLRENKRLINRAIRELDREKMGLEREEKRLTMEIKKAAKENQMSAVKIMAKDLVRTRQHIAKFIEMRRYVVLRYFGVSRLYLNLSSCHFVVEQSLARLCTEITNRKITSSHGRCNAEYSHSDEKDE